MALMLQLQQALLGGVITTSKTAAAALPTLPAVEGDITLRRTEVCTEIRTDTEVVVVVVVVVVVGTCWQGQHRPKVQDRSSILRTLPRLSRRQARRGNGRRN